MAENDCLSERTELVRSGIKMTFSVVQVENGRTRIIGTIWAGEESDARAIASNVIQADDPQSIVIRRTEQSEVPMEAGTVRWDL